jgi:DNA-binding MarR family transcriptional regulator
MRLGVAAPLTSDDYVALAELRYSIRRFLGFSEARARAEGLEPQQHQLLLAIKGLPRPLRPTIGVLGERLQIRHHSAVGLVDRSVQAGLVERTVSPKDRREVALRITPKGRRLLAKLSLAHRTELSTAAPDLVRALRTLVGARAGVA